MRYGTGGGTHHMSWLGSWHHGRGRDIHHDTFCGMRHVS